MKTNNTIAAYHIFRRDENGALVLNTNRLYHWNIPKRLREEPIQPGDIVQVPTKKGKRSVVVMNVFREDIEDTGREYKKVIKVLERAPKNQGQES
jgi:primosomal protein N'